MHRLIKIKNLSGYRFFRNFKWDESCNLFNRYNIIYGWNGCGKTTLCDFLKEFEKGQLSELNTKTTLLFEDSASETKTNITHNNITSFPYTFRVFHNDYVRENILEVDKIKHIFAVGAEQAEKIKEANTLKENLKTDDLIQRKLIENLLSLERSFEKFKTDRASLIKNTVNYSSAYNKNKFYLSCKNLKSKKLLSEEKHQQALTEIRMEKKEKIEFAIFSLIKSNIQESIISILEETPTNITIDALKNDGILNDWVEKGLSVHDERYTMTCQFCGNEMTRIRLDDLKAHFNKSYKDLSDKIDSCINLLNEESGKFKDVIKSLPHNAVFYAELKSDVDKTQETIKKLCEDNNSTISKIIEILSDKKSDMINISYVEAFKNIFKKMNFNYSCLDELIKLIDSHNNITQDFQKKIEVAQKKIEQHMVAKCLDEINTHEVVISQKKKEIEIQKKKIENTVIQIGLLEKQIKNSQIPAESINKEIEFIMGRNELIFKDTSDGYQIFRDGKIAKNLSKGEENAIALIYFFNTFTDVENDIQNTTIILDDPISSFDSNFYYNAIAFIREKTSLAGQVFIFTHKFSLFKDYALMYKGQSHRYMLKRIDNSPQLMNEDKLISRYHDEYAYLFKQIYMFVKAPEANVTDYLQYPNMARRLLEGFLTFKIPSEDNLITKVSKLEDGHTSAAGHAMLRLLNNHSHMRVISDGELAEDVANLQILPNILKHLLEFIKTYDAKHFENLISQCDSDSTNIDDLISLKQEKEIRIIKLFDIPVSADLGDIISKDKSHEDYETENLKADFALRVSDDMESDIPNESILLIKKMTEVENAKLGVFIYDGKVHCKKKIETENTLLLVSPNKKSPTVKVVKNSDFSTIGEVLDIIKSSL